MICFTKIRFWIIILITTFGCTAFGHDVNAQNNFYLKFGRNISNFRHEDLTNNKGISFGAGYKFVPISSINAFIALELLYTSKKGTLTNKTWPSYERDVTIGNIYIGVRNIEIPIKVGYFFNINKETEFQFFLGPSISRRIKNKTRIKIIDQFFFRSRTRERI